MLGKPNNTEKNNEQQNGNSQVVYERTQTDRLNRRLLCSLLDNLNKNDSQLQNLINNQDINNSNSEEIRMALMEDIFSDNILDEPDELERIEENDVISGAEAEGDTNDVNDDDTNKNDPEKKTKKRKLSTKPKLNILRLMSEKNGLTTLQNVFKDVKFKGKGNERDNLNFIMRKLEIWTHQLFPSMQFDDCLKKLEKLGTNQSVKTYVKKIRLDMDVPRVGDVIEDRDDSDDELQLDSAVSDFDRLINSQTRSNENQTNSTGISSGLSEEQRERMVKNRLIAEQRRLARMKARQEEQLMQEPQNNDTNKVQLESVTINDSPVNVGIPVEKVIEDPVADYEEGNVVENTRDTTSTVEEKVETPEDAASPTQVTKEIDIMEPTKSTENLRNSDDSFIETARDTTNTAEKEIEFAKNETESTNEEETAKDDNNTQEYENKDVLND